ncbi:MAG: translocation/assembly module TamB domain-containing protein [Moraxella sp.]
MKDPNNHEQPPKDPATDQPPALQTTSADEPSNDPEHGGSKRWRPLGILAKVLMVLLLVLVTIIVGVYYAVGTPWGTQLLIKALVKETGIRLKYGEGNLRDGLWVYDLTMPANPPKSYVEVTVDRAYVKVGWRAVLNKEVHLREAKIHNMVINYKKPPNNQPFDYEKISLPVNLTLDDVQANLVRYQQVTKEPLDFKQAHVQNFTWYDSQIKVGAAKLSYNELFSADQLSGNIDLQHDYPLDVTGQVVVHSLSKAYIDALDAHVMGSLKFMTADINSRYNNAAVTGHVTAQPLDDHAPFNAKVVWQEVLLPYATDQNIRLKNGVATASGVTDHIELRINTDLTAKDIPNGHYQGRGVIEEQRLKIEHLTAQVAQGQLTTQGTIDWRDRTRIALMNTGNQFNIRGLLPKDIAPYAPTTLTGKLSVVYDVATDKLPMQVRANLRQQDGEVINADIRKANGKNQPYVIDANWRQLVRHQLPNSIGELNSPIGKAHVEFLPQIAKKPSSLQVNASAHLIKLNQAPRGDYQLTLKQTGQLIDINQLVYQGVAGQLSGKGNIKLASAKQPLSWQINATTHNLNAHSILDSLPLQDLTGNVVASGIFQQIAQPRKKTLSRHDVTITQIDMVGDLLGADRSKKHLALTGAGRVKAELLANQLTHISAKFDGSLNAPNVPKGEFKFDVDGSPKQLTIRQFSHQGKQGGINAKGLIDLTQGIAWQIAADMQNFDASYFVPSLPSQLSGNLTTDGYWRDSAQYIHIANMNLKGRLKNKPLTAAGQLTAKLNLPKDLSSLRHIFDANSNDQKARQIRRLIDNIQANNLLLQWGDNRITANGNQNQLVTSVDISTLDALIPQVKGIIKGGIILAQDNQQSLPNIYIDLVGRNIAVPNFVVLDAKITGKLVNLANSPSQLQLNATGLNIANQPLRALQLHFNGTQNNHTLDIKTDSTKGQVQATLKGSIDLRKQQWQGVLGNGQIGTKYAKLQQLQPAQLLFGWQDLNVQMAAHCWQMVGQNGTLCLKNNLIATAKHGQVDLSVQQIDSQIFSVIMPRDIAWSGKLSGTALVHWQHHQKPTVNASFYSDNGVFGTAPQTPEENPTTIAYQRVSVIARSTPEGLKLRADLKTADNAGSGYVDATINPYAETKPISGSVVLQDINLAVFKPFFPSFERLTGNGLVAGKISGSLMQPILVGDIELQDAGLTITGVPMRFDNINVLAHVEGNQATLKGTFASAGDGKGNLTGTVDWTKELQAKLKLQGSNLQVSQPPAVTALINPIIDVIIKPNQRYVNIVGVVDVPRATIKPPEATSNVVSKSPDINVIDRRLMGQIDDVLRVSKPWSINADIGVDLGERVNFQGFGARLPLAGALHITQRGQGSMKAEGVVQVARRSKVEVFGQSLNLNFAQVRFNGDLLKPLLNVEAVKDVQGVQVGVKVKGNATEPTITVFNNGGLSEQQAMNALVTGSLNNNTGQNTSEQDFRNRVNNTIAAAGLSYGLSTTRQFTNEIGKAFGLQRLTLDANGSGNDTMVNLTGYITPDLLIRYGVGVFTAQPELSMRYQLTRRLYIEAKSAINNSVDLIYNWRY